MAKYKPCSSAQGQLFLVMYSQQIQPGTFELTLNHLIDNELDLSCFDCRFTKDETGAPSFDSGILLKIILFVYSRGITSSSKIAKCCEEHVIFMVLCSTVDLRTTEIFKMSHNRKHQFGQNWFFCTLAN